MSESRPDTVSNGARGEPPRYLGAAHTDSLLAGLLVLAQEIAVLQHRCAALEAERDGTEPSTPGAPEASQVVCRLVDELMATTRKETR